MSRHEVRIASAVSLSYDEGGQDRGMVSLFDERVDALYVDGVK